MFIVSCISSVVEYVVICMGSVGISQFVVLVYQRKSFPSCEGEKKKTKTNKTEQELEEGLRKAQVQIEERKKGLKIKGEANGQLTSLDC